MKNLFLRIFVQGTALFTAYKCIVAIRKQSLVKQTRKIRDQQARYGDGLPLSEEKQKLMDEADDYMQNHSGVKYMNRIRNVEYLRERLDKLIKQKKEQLEKQLEKEDATYSDELKRQIQQLNHAFSKTTPKYASLNDLEEPDIEDDKQKFYERK